MSDIKPNPTSQRSVIDAIAAKQVRDNVGRRNSSSTRGNSAALQSVSRQMANAVTDAKRIRQLTPHVTWIEKAILGSILTNGVGDTDRIEDLLLTIGEWSVGNTLSGHMTNVIREHLKNDYKISENLNDICRRALFVEGSSPILVIPEAAIDKMILDSVKSDSNISMEAELSTEAIAAKSLNIINSNWTLPTRPTKSGSINLESDGKAVETQKIEDVRKTLGYSFSDSLTSLMLPVVNAAKKAHKETQSLSSLVPNLESSMAGFNKSFLSQSIKSVNKHEVFKSIPHIKHMAEEGGQPIVMYVSARSVINITSPNDRRNIKGHILLIGEDGHPLNDHNDYLVNGFNTGYDGNVQASQAIQTAFVTMYGTEGVTANRAATSQELDTLYNSILEKDIENILVNSNIDGAVANLPEVSRVMLARMFRNSYTRMVYVPAGLMTYIAFDYDELGHGISLTERNKLVSTMHINLLLAKYISDFNNAINQQKLTIDLDDNDMDYENTISTIREEFFLNRTGANQYFSSNPMDSITQLQRAGVTTVINGGQAPGTKVAVEIVEGMRKTIDDDLLDRISRLEIMGYGAPPELIDSQGVDFAMVQLLNSDMFARTISQYKQDLSKHLTDHSRKYLMYHHDIFIKLATVIKEHKSSINDSYYDAMGITSAIAEDELIGMIIVDFLTHLEVSLPKLQRATNESMVEAIKRQGDLLDAILEECFSESSLGASVLGKLADNGFSREDWLGRIKAVKMREFCISKGLEPELLGLAPAEGNKSALPEILQELMNNEDNIRLAIVSWWEEATKVLADTNKKVDKLAEKLTAKYGEDTGEVLGKSSEAGDFSSGGFSSGGDGGNSSVEDVDDDFMGDTGLDSPPEEPEVGGSEEDSSAEDNAAVEEEDNPPEDPVV